MPTLGMVSFEINSQYEKRRGSKKGSKIGENFQKRG
jgi:hypothetical protein